ncbi:sigma 54-interacting transcriptional regulator, partial [candidate division KSB1 bacterium]|nr:sigma 54-interacting transcriptional regulator [candidate division KSB1 bacterium]
MNSKDELLQAILNSIGEGLFTVDQDFKITSFNRAAERMTGYTAALVLNKFCKHVFRTDKCQAGCPLALTLEKGENLYDYELYLRAGEIGQLQVKVNTAILFDREHQPVGGVLSFRESTPCSGFVDDLELQAHFEGMVGISQPLREIFTMIAEISDSDASVLIQGESGTGKELVANAIQRRSLRAKMPFIKINCSVFPETLLASELFGHIRGAFTGAQHDRTGRFEAANGGTVFLDEIAEASPQVQVQLLRILQDGTFERIGESGTRRTDVRIIAATNQNLELALKSGKFRDDLFYRLNVIPVFLPPLRERKMDIPLLIQFFINKYRRST